MYIEDEPWAEPVREVVSRFFKVKPDEVEIELDGDVVLIRSQNSMTVSTGIRTAVQEQVKMLLPPEHKNKQVSVV